MEIELDSLEKLFSEVVRMQALIHDLIGTPKDQRLFTTWDSLRSISRNTGWGMKQQLESNYSSYKDFLKEHNIEP